MPSRNKYRGYVKIPKKTTYRETLRLDFNWQIRSEQRGSKLEGFSLRLFVPSKKLGLLSQIELGISLRPEEWLDLIDAMKEEFEQAQQIRKESEGT